MKKAKQAAVIAAALLLAACQQEPAGEAKPETQTPPQEETGKKEVPAESEEIKASLIKQGENGRTWTYKVENSGKSELVIAFTSGQRYDYTVTDKKGESVYTWSADKVFLQAIGEETLKPGEFLAYPVQVDAAAAPGEYTLKVWMTAAEEAETHAVEIPIEITK